MIEEPTLPRPFGDFLLVAQLGDDPLGSVYRAIHSADEKRFLRLRILQSGELSPRGVLAAVRRLEGLGPALAHDGIVRRPQFGIVGNAPYMAWYESAGWTLDRVLTRARGAKAPVTTEYALLLGERMIEATSAATRFLEEDLAPHGVLWPGFVSISNDAEVRIAGFGLAAAILPALRKPRMLREVAPYVAPEAREGRRVSKNSDVYSLAIMLLELLTGRRPALGAPLPELRASDPFSTEIGAFLRRALAPSEERYASIEEMRVALQETRMAAPRLLYPAGLAFYLYRLLNPEIHAVTPTDPDSTNPVETEPRLAGGAVLRLEEILSTPAPIPAPVSTLAIEPPFDLAETPEPASETDFDAIPDDAIEPPPSIVDVAAAGSRDEESQAEDRDETPVSAYDPILPPPASLPRFSPRARGMGALLFLAGTVFGLAVLIDNERAKRVAVPTPRTAESRTAPEPPRRAAVASVALAASAPPTADPETPAAELASPPPRPSESDRASAPAETPKRRPRRAESDTARRGAEDFRFQAAFARVAAQRNDGEAMAAESFQEGSSRQIEGESLYRQGHFDQAQQAFEDAARLFREAETISHEEQVRRVQVSSSR